MQAVQDAATETLPQQNDAIDDLTLLNKQEWMNLPEKQKRQLMLKKVQGVLESTNVAYVATAGSWQPSVNSVFFIHDIDEKRGTFVLYGFTLLVGEKGYQMWVNPNVTVQINARDVGQKKTDGKIEKVESLQIKGKVEFLKDKAMIKRVRERFNEATEGLFESLFDLPIARWWKITPTQVKYTNWFSAATFYFLEYREQQPGYFKSMLTSIKKTVLYWFLLVRAPFFTATVAPILLGTAVAATHLPNGLFSLNWGLFFLTLVAGILIHAGVNVLNDYFDHVSRGDDINQEFTPVNGGSRVIQAGLVSSHKAATLGTLFLLTGVLMGLYIHSQVDGLGLPLLIGLGVFLGFFYTAPPFKLANRGFGEPAVAIGFSLYLYAAYYIQTRQFTIEMVVASLPLAILIMLVLFINEFGDYNADAKVGKRTWVVRLGKDNAIKLYQNLILLTHVLVLGVALFNIWALLGLFSLPLALKAIKHAREHYHDTFQLLPANFATIFTHLSTGILLTIAYVIYVFVPISPLQLLGAL